MTITPIVSALTCPACGGPLTGAAARRCRFCGVALVVPFSVGPRFMAGEPAATQQHIAWLRDQLRLDPTRAETHRQLGHAYVALELADDAVRALTVAVGLAPEELSARLELATLLAGRSAAGVPDAYLAAMRHTRQVLALAPDSPDGQLLLARLLTQRGEYDGARAILREITALPDSDTRRRAAWVTLAEAADHDRRGNRLRAVAAWRRAATDAPDLVQPAVAAFLARSPPMSARKAERHRSASRLGGIMGAGLVVALVVLAGLTPGLPSPALIALGIVPLLLAVMIRPALRFLRSTARAGGTPTRPATLELDRSLRSAELIARRTDLVSDRRQLDWADNLAVALPWRRQNELVGPPRTGRPRRSRASRPDGSSGGAAQNVTIS